MYKNRLAYYFVITNITNKHSFYWYLHLLLLLILSKMPI